MVSISEFELIQTYFATATAARSDVLLGIGDDCALLRPPVDSALAVSLDTLVEGRHFLPGADPDALGHKALAVNLSDLAAMGAQPAWAMLALTLPRADPAWLRAFADGFAGLAAEHGVQLVGGDTTRGPLSITVQVHGFVDPDVALRRGGARAGDRLLVSGNPGDAGLALQQLHDPAVATVDPRLLRRLLRPSPRVALGRLLAGRASAAIDVSDGLLADLGHICAASGLGARVELDRLPLSAAVRQHWTPNAWPVVLSGGDDYELLFSVAADRLDQVEARCRAAGEAVQVIGRLTEQRGITLVYPDGRERMEAPVGFDHFRS